MNSTAPDLDLVKELLRYDHKTGNLFWRVDRRNDKAGDQADKINSRGYFIVRLPGRAQQSHRLAWFYVHGYWPGNIGHINRVKTDNRIENLREADGSINQRNLRMSPRNKSGFNGVRWSKRDKIWYAQITLNNRNRYLGIFKTKEEAIAARQAANIKYGFSEDHGKLLPHEIKEPQ